jgi:hypothetical protein
VVLGPCGGTTMSPWPGTGGGIIAGAWAGDFADREIAEAPTSVGTALCVTREGVVAVVGTAGAAPLHRYRSRRCVVLSNSLALA